MVTIIAALVALVLGGIVGVCHFSVMSLRENIMK